MLDFLPEPLAILLIGLFILMIPFTALFGLAIWLDSAGCESKAATMEMPHKYGPLMGCMVQAKDGRWWPIERYSHMSIED